MSICIECQNHLSSGLAGSARYREDQFCKAHHLEKAVDPFDGKRKCVVDFGCYYQKRELPYKNCYKVNSHDCPKFKAIKEDK